MRSVVTGGAGFIGSTLTDHLVGRGDSVLVLDDLSTGWEENLEDAIAAGASLTVGDIVDERFVRDAVTEFEPDAIYHLAAQADVRRGVAEPAFDARVNILGTINVLEAARRAGGCPVVFAATGGAVYGEGEGRSLPFTEDVPAEPETPYGAGKFAAEGYVALYHRLHGVPGVSMRFANVYGPRQDPHGEAGVVAIFCGKLLAGESAIVYGDGEQTRDYVYVDDVVAAMVAGREALAGDPEVLRGPYNVGTGIETSVLELYDRLTAAAGVDRAPVMAQARVGEVQRVSVDPTKARVELGWEPTVDFDTGLRATLEQHARGTRSTTG